MRHTSVFEQRLQDLRFAIRQLVKYPGYGAAAAIVPALGIAASVALFGFVDAAMIKPLPYSEPSRLVTMFGTTPNLAARQIRGPVSYLDFRDWRERTRMFGSIAAYDVRAGFTVTTAAGPERVAGLRVTSGFFRTLGVTLLMGRDLGPEDEGSAAAPAVLISYSAWQRRFGVFLAVLGMRFLASLLTADMFSRMPYFQGVGFNSRLALFAIAVTAAVAGVLTLTPLTRIPASGRLALR